MGRMIEEDSPETPLIPVGIYIYGTIYVPHTKHLSVKFQLKRFLKMFFIVKYIQSKNLVLLFKVFHFLESI